MTESELLFTQALNCNRANLYFDKGKYLTLSQASFISSVLKRRISGEPIQYILGKTEFMGLEFKVNRNVLIPRPETEILVETALRYAGSLSHAAKRILELGTGAGCIAVSLAKFLPAFTIVATDISLGALKVAEDNARLNEVTDKIIFLASDLFGSLAMRSKKYTICVCNPPYIPSDEIGKLQPEIQYEPRSALDGGRGGLDFYRKIIKGSLDYLEDGGILILEIGFNQKQGIEDIFCRFNHFKIIEIIKDYNKIDRVIIARKG